MTQICRESVSFLKLERHALGELAARDGEQLQRHFGSCELCTARHARIVSGVVALRPLPRALPAAPAHTKSPGKSRGGARLRFATWDRLRWAVPALAAAALLLLLVPHEPTARTAWPSARRTIKGGSLALYLVRERHGSIALDPSSYRDDDHFKVLLTCPITSKVHWDVVVFQAKKAFFPLSPTAAIECGNQVPLDGAFTLVGQDPITVCVSVDPARAIDRAALIMAGAAALAADSACVELKPALRAAPRAP